MKKKTTKKDLNEQLAMSIDDVADHVVNAETSADLSLLSEKEDNEIKENLSNTNNGFVVQDENITEEKKNKRKYTKKQKTEETEDKFETIVDEAIVKEKLREVEESQSQKKKAKSIIINSLMIVINLFIMVFIISSFLKNTQGSDFSSVAKAQGDRLWWLALAFGLYVIMLLANALNNFILIKSTSGIKNFYLAYRVSVIGKYYDNITPFAVGGQPFQIVTMSKAGIKPGTATSIPIIKLIVNNIVVSIFALAAFIFGIPQLPETSELVHFLQISIQICGVIGLIICAFMGFLLLFLGNRRIVGKSFSRWLVRLGYKLRIVKDYRKSFEKFNNQVIEYQNSTSYLAKNKGVMISIILLCALENIAYTSIPFAILMAFSSIQITCFTEFFYIWGICVVIYYICSMAASGIPLPGGTGMMELAFMLFFCSNSLMGEINVVWGLLFFRVFSYYIIVIHGFIQTLIDSSVSIAKNKAKESTIRQE